jgi:hypothetical protein
MSTLVCCELSRAKQVVARDVESRRNLQSGLAHLSHWCVLKACECYYSELDVRFIALLSPFDRAQSPVCGEKAWSSRLKCHLDLEPWVLPGEINAMENCAGCNEGLATLSGEADV